MNPPRWTGPNADRTRAELLRRVETGESSPSPAAAVRTGRLRLAVAVVVALALVVPATVLALRLGGRAAPAGGSEVLTVATDASYAYDRMGDYAGVVGVLNATRSGGSACFWVTPTTPSSVFGEGPFFLVFPGGYRASRGLQLLDEAGRVVASPGDVVGVSTMPLPLTTTPAGCGRGTALGALHLDRASLPTPETTTSTADPTVPATTRAQERGCRPTGAVVPTGAEHARITDVDGDGRADTEWAELKEGGTLEFGVTTASGATIRGQQGFAGGGDRSFVVGRLANGVVVGITSEGRDSPVYTFSGCAFHQLHGKDLLPGTDASSPFTFYSETDGGAGGCFDGRLALLSSVATSSREGEAVARWVDVSADGRRATLTDETAVVARRIDPEKDPARFNRYFGISCGSSAVLRPHLSP